MAAAILGWRHAVNVLENPAEIVRVRVTHDLADCLDVEAWAPDHQASGFSHTKVNQVLDRRHTHLPFEDPDEIGGREVEAAGDFV